ncbi:DMT family transporter [uncultured Desulfosarcina sp.]|uniref:DMT family transporter n=1 Tax=uncultured Desulfosarcina sp. TaxID=218289 RepID=UPI0029C9789B|nr:DMT family transporter [uncultured Desulfosarcina sp.]
MQLIGILCSTGAAFFWAAAVIMFKKSGEAFSPMALNLFKGVVTLLLLVPTLWFAGVALFPVRPAHDWVLFCISGFLGITLADTFFFMALKRLGAGRWAVVDCLYLPFIIFISTLFLNESIGLKGILGALLVIGAIGADACSKSSVMMSRKDFWLGLVFGVLAVILIAGSVVMVKPLLEETSVLWASFVRLLAGVAGLIVIAVIHPERRVILGALMPSSAWKIVLPASIVGNYMAMLAWLAGFKYTLVSVAAILNQLSTIFTFILAAVFLKEPVTPPRMIAIVMAVSGALLAASAV